MDIKGTIQAYLDGNIEQARQWATAANMLFIRIVFALVNEFNYQEEQAIAIAREIKDTNCFTNGI